MNVCDDIIIDLLILINNKAFNTRNWPVAINLGFHFQALNAYLAFPLPHGLLRRVDMRARLRVRKSRRFFFLKYDRIKTLVGISQVK